MDPNRSENRNNRNNPSGEGQKPKGNLLVTLIVTVAIILIISGVFNVVRNSQYVETSYSDFLAEVQKNNLAAHLQPCLGYTPRQAKMPLCFSIPKSNAPMDV